MKSPVLPILLLLTFTPHLAMAAPAMASPECTLSGFVMQEKERIEPYEDENWRESWGLPENRIYHDVLIKVITNDYASDADRDMATQMTPPEDCDKAGWETTYQLRDDTSFFGLFAGKSDITGKCIRAKSKASGDEFSFGNWLYDIEVIAQSECMTNNNK